MIHVVLIKRPVGVPLLIHMSFYEGVGVLKISESESEFLCTDSTALIATEAWICQRLKNTNLKGF
jgi:hypothetical protein